jgi:hypothetical protein
MRNMEQTNEETRNSEIEDSQKLAETVTGALRGPKYGIFEQLICQRLIQATVTTDPLRNVQLITEATLMIDSEMQKTLKLDMEKTEIVKLVCDALQHRVSTNLKDHIRPLVTVKWGFPLTEENFKKFIEPWNNASLQHFPAHIQSKHGFHYRYWVCANCQNTVGDSIRGNFETEKGSSYGYLYDKKEMCKFCGIDLEHGNYRNPYPFVFYIGFEWDSDATNAERFFAVTEVLTQDGYASLETNFLAWAMPFIMDTTRRLTEAVKPEIYNQIAKMMIKPKDEAEK